MIDLIEVRTTQGALLGLPLDDLTSGYIIADVKGLDPVKATLVSTSFANMDGAQYQSSKRETRNIRLSVELSDDYVTDTIRTIRNRLYGYFMPKSEVNLRFYLNDGLEVAIVGRVESCEANHFTKEPTVDISVLCFDPDFYEINAISLSGNTTATTTETLVDYTGTVETGVEFTLAVNRALSEFAIYHRPPDGSLRTLEFVTPLVAGDVLTITTIPGAKGAVLTRAGSDSSVLYGISPQSNWLEFLPGDNYIRVYAEGAAIPYNITYTNKHGGL